MQASRITVGNTYAVKRSGVLMRFRVTKVATIRGSSTYSEVTGVLVDQENDMATMPVSEVIGPYAEQAELAEKARKEMEERQQAAGAIKAKQDRLVNLFFGKTGLSKSPKSEYSNPFRATYHGVEISKEGIEALLKFFDTDHAERKYGV